MLAPVWSAIASAAVDHLLGRRVAFRRGNADARAERRRGQHQRVGDVVAVAHVGERNVFQLTELFLQGEVVGQRLAGMLQAAKRVDHRNGGECRHLFDGFLIVSTQHDGVHPALDVVRDVGQSFAGAEALLGLIDEEGGAAQAGHAGLEGQPGAQRGLLEKHHHLFSGERPAEVSRTRLHQGGEVQYAFDFARAKVAAGNQVTRPEVLRRQRLRSGCAFYWLDAQFFLPLAGFFAAALERADIQRADHFVYVLFLDHVGW